jgi:hypothetical protein
MVLLPNFGWLIEGRLAGLARPRSEPGVPRRFQLLADVLYATDAPFKINGTCECRVAVEREILEMRGGGAPGPPGARRWPPARRLHRSRGPSGGWSAPGRP